MSFNPSLSFGNILIQLSEFVTKVGEENEAVHYWAALDF